MVQAIVGTCCEAGLMSVWIIGACVHVFREASALAEDLKGLVEELEQDQQMSLISVELVDDELARVYANSNKAQVCQLFICWHRLFIHCSSHAHNLFSTNTS